MASAIDVRRIAYGLGAIAFMALCTWFGTGLHPLWPLMWFAPVLLLLFSVDTRWWIAALAAAVGMVLGVMNLLGLFYGALQAPIPILIQIYFTEGLMFALAVLLFRALMRRKAYWSALLAFPAFWTSFEYLLNLTSIHGTAGSLAYTQLGFLPFLQLASITGPWGMTFLLWSFPAALAIGIHLSETERTKAVQITGVTAAVIALVLVLGTVRLFINPEGVPVKVGLIASDGPNEDVAEPGTPTIKLLSGYAKAVEALAQQGAEAIVMPEKTSVFLDPETQQLDTQLQALANAVHARLVVGVVRVVPQPNNALPIKYNEARIYTPGGTVESYDKEHMLPPFESRLTPGTSLTLLTAATSTWGVEICKDMDFTQLSREYGQAGAGLMLVPGWDFGLDWIHHGHMAIMRGVESGFSIVRSAKDGSLFVSDDRGRILGETMSGSAPFSTLVVSVPQSHDKTLFLLLGDWFAWVALALLVLCLAQLARRWKAGQA